MDFWKSPELAQVIKTTCGWSRVQRLNVGTPRDPAVRVAVGSSIAVSISRNLLETTVYLLSIGFRKRYQFSFFLLARIVP